MDHLDALFVVKRSGFDGIGLKFQGGDNSVDWYNVVETRKGFVKDVSVVFEDLGDESDEIVQSGSFPVRVLRKLFKKLRDVRMVFLAPGSFQVVETFDHLCFQEKRMGITEVKKK